MFRCTLVTYYYAAFLGFTGLGTFGERKYYTHSRRGYYVVHTWPSRILQDVSIKNRDSPRGFGLPENHSGGGLQRGASELEGGEVREWEVEFGV